MIKKKIAEGIKELSGSGIFNEVPAAPIAPPPIKKTSAHRKNHKTFCESFSITEVEANIIQQFKEAVSVYAVKKSGRPRKVGDSTALKVALRIAANHLGENHAIEKHTKDLIEEDPRGRR